MFPVRARVRFSVAVFKPRLAAASKPSGAPRRKRRDRMERQVQETTRRVDLKTIVRHACAVGRGADLLLTDHSGSRYLPIWDSFLHPLLELAQARRGNR